MFKFEKLDVWQKAIDFADLLSSQTSLFPANERFGLTNQMRRAAVSVSSNITEGRSQISNIDFARFVEITTGSLFKVVTESAMAKPGFLNDETFALVYKAAEEQCRMLSGLRRRLVGNNN